jgi:hypothetical protein
MQRFFNFFVPRVWRLWNLSGPDETAPQEDKRQTGQNNFPDKTLWIVNHKRFNV